MVKVLALHRVVAGHVGIMPMRAMVSPVVSRKTYRPLHLVSGEGWGDLDDELNLLLHLDG